jgi:hypothetical protein
MMSRYKPVGWRNDHTRHYLAAKYGSASGNRYMRAKWKDVRDKLAIEEAANVIEGQNSFLYEDHEHYRVPTNYEEYLADEAESAERERKYAELPTKDILKKELTGYNQKRRIAERRAALPKIIGTPGLTGENWNDRELLAAQMHQTEELLNVNKYGEKFAPHNWRVSFSPELNAELDMLRESLIEKDLEKRDFDWKYHEAVREAEMRAIHKAQFNALEGKNAK